MSDLRPSRRRLLLTLLIVSVALNCVLVGFFLGRALSPPFPPGHGAGKMANIFMQRIRSLPPEEQEKYQDVMAIHREEIRHAREAAEAARGERDAAFAAEPYDPERMRRAFANWRTKNLVVQTLTQDAMAQALAALSPQSRKRLAPP